MLSLWIHVFIYTKTHFSQHNILLDLSQLEALASQIFSMQSSLVIVALKVYNTNSLLYMFKPKNFNSTSNTKIDYITNW